MSSPTGSAPLDLIREDGAVIVPAAIAGDVVRALVRDLAARVRADGGEVSPGVRRLLIALHSAEQRAEAAEIDPSSDAGTTQQARANVEIGTGEAAALLECSTEYVRRLARSGRVQARRIGAAWLIDSASLDAYRTGAAPCPAPQSRSPT